MKILINEKASFPNSNCLDCFCFDAWNCFYLIKDTDQCFTVGRELKQQEKILLSVNSFPVTHESFILLNSLLIQGNIAVLSLYFGERRKNNNLKIIRIQCCLNQAKKHCKILETIKLSLAISNSLIEGKQKMDMQIQCMIVSESVLKLYLF